MNKNFTNALRGLAILLVVIQHIGGVDSLSINSLHVVE